MHAGEASSLKAWLCVPHLVAFGDDGLAEPVGEVWWWCIAVGGYYPRRGSPRRYVCLRQHFPVDNILMFVRTLPSACCPSRHMWGYIGPGSLGEVAVLRWCWSGLVMMMSWDSVSRLLAILCWRLRKASFAIRLIGKGGYPASSTQLNSTCKFSLYINKPTRLNSLTKQAPDPNPARIN
jgi:hypothetical protein